MMAIAWDKITPQDIVTWVMIAGSWVIFWVHLRFRVDGHGEALKKIEARMDRQEERISDMKDHGSPASRQALSSLNSLVDSTRNRLTKVEEAVMEWKLVKQDIEWIKAALQKKP